MSIRTINCPLCGKKIDAEDCRVDAYELLAKHIYADDELDSHDWHYFEKLANKGNLWQRTTSFYEDGRVIKEVLADEALHEQMMEEWAMELLRRIGT